MSDEDLRALAKVDLHRHLEGAIRLQTVFELSREAGVPLPADTVEDLARYALVRTISTLETLNGIGMTLTLLPFQSMKSTPM